MVDTICSDPVEGTFVTMKPLVDAQEAVSLCNSVLAIAGVKNPVSTVPEVRTLGANVSLYVAATEVLLGQRLEKIHRSPSNAIQRSANCAAVLFALESALGGISLAHIIPSAVVSGDLLHITSVMDLIVELSHMPEVLKLGNSKAQAAAGVPINQYSSHSSSKLASTRSKHRATGETARSYKMQADLDKAVASPAGAATSVVQSTGKFQLHPKRASSPVNLLVPAAAAAAADPVTQAAVQQQHRLPTAAVATDPGAAVMRQPGSRSASPRFRSGTPAWPGDLADTSSTLQGLADYKPKQLQHIMGLANSLLEQQHSGSDVGRSGTPVFGRSARACSAAATAAAVNSGAMEHEVQGDNKMASAALWIDAEEAENYKVLQRLRAANQNINDSRTSAAVPAAAADRMRAMSPLRHQQHEAASVEQSEQARIGTASVTVPGVEQQLLLHELEVNQTLDNHMDSDLKHMRGVAQQLAEIREAEEQLGLVEQQIQQHMQLLHQQDQKQAGSMLTLPTAATTPQGGMSCVIKEITSSTDLDSHKMQGNISRAECWSVASGSPPKQRHSNSCYATYVAPDSSSDDYDTSSPVMQASVHVPTTATDSAEAVGVRLLDTASRPDLHLGLQVLSSTGPLEPVYDADYDEERDPAIETIVAFFMNGDVDPDFGVDIDEYVTTQVANCIASRANERHPDCAVDTDEQAAAEAANCIGSLAHLDHLQEVVLGLATLQEQRQRQQLQQQKESFRRQSQAEDYSDSQHSSGDSNHLVTLAAWNTVVQLQQQAEEDSDRAVKQQHHQQIFGQVGSEAPAGQPAAAARAYKIHKTQLPSSSNKPGGQRRRKGSKHSPAHDAKRKQELPALHRASDCHHSVQQSPHTPYRLSSSSSRGCSDRAKHVAPQSSQGRSASAVHHSSASPGSQATPQQHAQATRYKVGANETRRKLLPQLSDNSSSNSESSFTIAEPLTAQDSWSHAATGYQMTGALTMTEMPARDQRPTPQKHQHEPSDQQQSRKTSATAAAAKVMDARIQFEIAQQHMQQHQVLKQQAAAVRRQTVKVMQQQELLSKQEAYNTKVVCLRAKQRRDKQRRDKLRNHSHAATQAATEAAQVAGMSNLHHATTSSRFQSPHRLAASRSSPPKQLALQTRGAAAEFCGNDAMCKNADVVGQLQQLRVDYEKVICVFEDVLVSERRGRVDAERSLAQLVRQLRSEGKLGSPAISSVLCQ